MAASRRAPAEAEQVQRKFVDGFVQTVGGQVLQDFFHPQGQLRESIVHLCDNAGLPHAGGCAIHHIILASLGASPRSINFTPVGAGTLLLFFVFDVQIPQLRHIAGRIGVTVAQHQTHPPLTLFPADGVIFVGNQALLLQLLNEGPGIGGVVHGAIGKQAHFQVYLWGGCLRGVCLSVFGCGCCRHQHGSHQCGSP